MQFPYSLNTKGVSIVREYSFYIHSRRYTLSHRVRTAVTLAEQQQQQNMTSLWVQGAIKKRLKIFFHSQM